MRAGRITLPTTPSSFVPLPFQFTPAQPRPAMVAPTSPPNSACDELEGSPSSQVNRFQTMPPIRPASTISNRAVPPSVVSDSLGVPSEFWMRTTALLTVRATSTERKAPMRLRMPESATAVLGRRARVAMEVAIAFAVSWNPLVKSNPRAVTTTSARITDVSVTPSGSLLEDRTRRVQTP
jgi:hypothetical protein